MRIRTIIAAVLIAAVVAGVGWYALSKSPIERVFGGSANMAIVARPTKVEAFRIGPLPEDINWQDASFSDYPVIAGPVAVPKAVAAEVSDALLSPSTYVWDSAKACSPVYGVRLSFIQGADSVDVLLCFECDMLWVGRNGRGLGGEDFDNARAVLVRAAKAAFPDDEVIQKLNEDRHAG